MLFARLQGEMDWCCPVCNVLHVTRLKAQGNKALYCGKCQVPYYPGTVLYKAPMGPKPLPPRDTLMIGGGFPLKREVNRVYCSNCSEEILSRVVEKMIHHDLTPIPGNIHIPQKPHVHQSPVEIPDPDDLIG